MCHGNKNMNLMVWKRMEGKKVETEITGNPLREFEKWGDNQIVTTDQKFLFFNLYDMEYI